MTEHVPAPWTLTGNGVILLYRFPHQFVLDNGFVPPQLRDSFVGGIGSVMLVDYHTSNVGAYGELLFIPGQFQFGTRRYYTITKIYVSSQISVDNGHTNWAIPKQRADFAVTEDARIFQASQDGKAVFDISIEPRLLSLPVNTAWSPIKLSLGQIQNESLFITTPGAKGKVQLALIRDIRVNPLLFPDIAAFRPLAAFRARDFTMTFPIARVEPLSLSPGAAVRESQ
jgi:hypothetical protein